MESKTPTGHQGPAGGGSEAPKRARKRSVIQLSESWTVWARCATVWRRGERERSTGRQGVERIRVGAGGSLKDEAMNTNRYATGLEVDLPVEVAVEPIKELVGAQGVVGAVGIEEVV